LSKSRQKIPISKNLEEVYMDQQDQQQVDWKAYKEEAERMLREEGWIPIFEKFCPELEKIILSLIFQARSKKKEHIVLLINSNGGSISSLVAIKAAIKIAGLKTVGIVLGQAKSAAFQLLQQCDVRYAVHGSSLMPHWGSCSFGNNELAAIMAGDMWPIDHQRSLRNLLFNDALIKTGVDKDNLQTIYNTDRVFTSAEALALNFIDKVIDEFNQDTLNPFKKN